MLATAKATGRMASIEVLSARTGTHGKKGPCCRRRNTSDNFK